MAIATCNIKVNGRWVRAGESYEPEAKQVTMAVEPEKPEAPREAPEATEEPKPAPRPRTSTRRKTK